MSREEDSPRQRFTKLVQADLDERMDERSWSVSEFIRQSGVGRATIYEWLKPDSERMPKPEKVRLYATRLGTTYARYATALGWSESPDLPEDLPGFIRRARLLADHPGTSEERRRELERRIAEAEFALDSARDMERRGEDLLREALGETEDHPEA